MLRGPRVFGGAGPARCARAAMASRDGVALRVRLAQAAPHRVFADR